MVSNRANHGFSRRIRFFRPAPLQSFWSVVSSGMLPLVMGCLVACSPLEPIIEPEVSDLQLTVDTLKTTIRDAQRTIAELRTELDSRRQELAEVQIARAQLEGRVREAERRLVEARHVIDLQREELAGSRSNRERAARTSAALQNQLRQLQKQISKIGKQVSEARGSGMVPASLPSPRGKQSGMALPELEQAGLVEDSANKVSMRAAQLQEGPSIGESPVPDRVSVKSGDTLWSIARRYNLSLSRLMAINQLPDSLIQVGQALWLTEPAATGGRVSQ